MDECRITSRAVVSSVALGEPSSSKVIFLANSAWYLSNFRTNTIQAFSNAGFQVVLVSPDGSGEPPAIAGVSHRTFKLNNAGTNPIQEFRSVVELWRVLRKIRPDVVFSFNPKTNLYGLLVCKLLGVRCVPNVSGVGSASELGGWKGRVYRSLMKFAFRFSDHLFFQNQEDMQAYEEMGLTRTGAYERLPGSGVDLQRFQPALHDDSDDRPVTFLLACRLIYPKGVLEFLQAAKQLHDQFGTGVRFLLAGVPDTSGRAVPSSVISEYEQMGCVEFLGEVTDMPLVLCQADAVVLPSWYPEGVPRSLLEAAAAGKVIITTNTPGCRDVVDEGHNGFFVESESVESLVARLKEVVEMPSAERAAMGQQSRKIAEERFDEQQVIERYLQVARKA